MKKIVITYIITAIIFLLLDAAWLGFIASQFYEENLGSVINIQFRIFPAGIFYALYIAGILYFTVFPALKANSWKKALLNGALLGGLCYATYDLTNMAVIADWPLLVTVVDILWGVVITGSTATISSLLVRKIS